MQEQELRKIKIVQPGWETYSGPFGYVVFEDGVSVEPVPWVAADRVAADLLVVDAETGAQIGPQVRLLEARCVPLDALDQLETAENEPAPVVAAAPPDPVEPEKIWTAEELHDIADKEGIKGLRRIGDPLGAKGRAIPELIDDILAAQDALARAAASRLPREG